MPNELIERIIDYRIQNNDYVLDKEIEKLEIKIKSVLKRRDDAFDSLQTWKEYKDVQKVVSMHKFIAGMINEYAKDNNFVVSEEIKEVLSDVGIKL